MSLATNEGASDLDPGTEEPAAIEAPIKAERVTKEYLGGKRIALDDVSVDIYANQVTALIGPSGCGKTTLLRLIAGLEFPTYGMVSTHGHPIKGPGPDRGMVFQAYTSFPWLTAIENVAHGMAIQGVSESDQTARPLFLSPTTFRRRSI